MAIGDPTLGDFEGFVANYMGVPSTAMNPATSPYVPWAYNYALQIVNQALQCVPGVTGAWSVYALAVYNLAADTLVNIAQDASGAPIYQNNLPYWQWLRGQYGVLSFTPGVVSSSSDEGTSTSYTVPRTFENYTIANLNQLKTPYGRQYLGLASSWGTVWGLS